MSQGGTDRPGSLPYSITCKFSAPAFLFLREVDFFSREKVRRNVREEFSGVDVQIPMPDYKSVVRTYSDYALGHRD